MAYFPLNAIQDHTPSLLSFSSEFFICIFHQVSDMCLETSTKNDQDHYVSQACNNFSGLRLAIGSDANRCCSSISGADAASSSKIHDQSNSETLTSFIEKDSHTVFELTSADDCEALNSIENILTSIENVQAIFVRFSKFSWSRF